MLSDEELESVNIKILRRPPAGSTESLKLIDQDLDEINRQNALLQLDQEWEARKQKYLLRGRDGARYIPSKKAAIRIAIGGVVFGAITLVMADGAGAHRGVLAICSVIFIGAVLTVAWARYSRSDAFHAAEAAYQERRRQIKAGNIPPGYSLPPVEDTDIDLTLIL